MNLFQQLSAAAGMPVHQLSPQTSSPKPPLAKRRSGHSTSRKAADAAWERAFGGEFLTAPELARRRHLNLGGMPTILKHLENRGIIAKVDDQAFTVTRRATLWRWVGETEE